MRRSFNEKSFESFSRPKRDRTDPKYSSAEKAVSFDLQTSNKSNKDYNVDTQSQYKVPSSKQKLTSSKNANFDVFQPIRKLRSLVNHNESYDRDTIDRSRNIGNNSFSQHESRKQYRTISQNNLDNSFRNEPYLQLPPENRDRTRIRQGYLNPDDSQLTFEDSLNLLSSKSPREECNDEMILDNKKGKYSSRVSRDTADTRNLLTEESFILDSNSQKEQKTKVRRIASLGRQTSKKESEERFKRVYDWRKQHAILMQSVRGPGLDEPDLAKEDHIQCEYCTRSFDPLVAKRHIPKCKETRHRPNPPPLVVQLKKDPTPTNSSAKSVVKKADLSFANELNKSMTFKGKFIPCEEQQESQKPRNNTSSGPRQPVRPIINGQRNWQTDHTMESDHSFLDYSLQQYITDMKNQNAYKIDTRDCSCSDKNSEGSCDKCRSTGCSNLDYEDKFNQTFNIEAQNHTFARGWNNKRQKPSNTNESSYALPALLQYKPNGYQVGVQEQNDSKRLFEQNSFSKERISTKQSSEAYIDGLSKAPCPFCNKLIPSRSLNSHVPLCKALKNQSNKLLFEQSGIVETEKYFSLPKGPVTRMDERNEDKPVISQRNKNKNTTEADIFSDDLETKFPVSTKDSVSSANLLLNRLRFVSQKASSQLRHFDTCKYCGSGISKTHAYCGICGKKKIF